MGCTSCSVSKDGKTKGCGNNGGCSSGGCNKLNAFDWLSDLSLPDYGSYDLLEVSFKNGGRKEIYKVNEKVHVVSGDVVAVEGLSGGYDIGQVSLMGELVQLQLKKYKIRDNHTFPKILRIANERDLERLGEARALERDTMIKSRVIARDLGLNMKIGDVEYQGDKRKVTFYYTAEGRVDFRELIRIYAREFKVKIEMRQIGSRQESAKIGGLGSCGRELCCSTWLTDFKSVSTAAARYQNLAINQAKLSGQCGRLKCCLNYELSNYLEVLKEFPKNVDKIRTKKGIAFLLKTDIFKRQLFYAYRNDFGISEVQVLSIPQVNELKRLNDSGVEPETLTDIKIKNDFEKDKEEEIEFVDNIDGVLHLKPFEKKKKRRGKGRRNNRKPSNNSKSRPSNKEGQSKGKPNKEASQQKKGPSANTNTGGDKQRPKARRNHKNRGPKRRNSTKKPNNNQSNDGSTKKD